MTELRLVDVTKKYGTVVALDNYSISVPKGSVTAFVGANAAGKSTAMKLLSGIRIPNSGKVLFENKPFTEVNRRKIGYMPEDRGLYEDETLRSQFLYFVSAMGIPPKKALNHIETIFERVGIAENSEKNLPN